MELVARCDTVDAVMAAAEHGADVVIFGGESYHHRPFLKEDWQVAVKAAHDHGAALWAGTPRIVREGHRRAVQSELERAVASGIDGIYVGAMAVFTMAKKGWKRPSYPGRLVPQRLQQPSCLDLCGPRLASGITASLEATLRTDPAAWPNKSPCPNLKPSLKAV